MRKIIISIIVYFTLLFTESFCQKPATGNSSASTTGMPAWSYSDINYIGTTFKNVGTSDIDIFESNSGFHYPVLFGKTAVFESGFLWGLKIQGDPQVRVGGSTYRTGLQGGKILSSGVAEDPSDPHVRIYRVRRDVYPGGPAVDLTQESFFEGKSLFEIRTQYETDWLEWRAQDGAPFEDMNSNGIYEPLVDIPGYPGADQTLWYVANDLDPAATIFLYGTNPIGMELQVTVWSYHQNGSLDHLLFRKYRMINKSTTNFNDMYVTMWSDPDIGFSTDDFVGCDTTLNLVYAYNGTNADPIYEYTPAGVGFNLLESPDNLGMTASYYFTRGDASVTDPLPGNPLGADQFYNFMKGLIGLTGDPIIDPTNNLETKFPLNGDPLTGQGWIDGLLQEPGDRRIGLASGSFNMAPGDTQDVVVSEIASLGIDNLNAIRLLRFYSILSKELYNNSFNMTRTPFPTHPLDSVAIQDRQVTIFWDTAAATFNQNGFEFQGYNVYQLASNLPLKSNAVRLATYDVIDGVTDIQGTVMNPVTGYPENGIEQHGSDSGILQSLLITEDVIDSTNYLIPGKPYYFGITSYAYNSEPGIEPNNSESIMKIIEVVVHDSIPGPNYGDTLLVTHSTGVGAGDIYVTIDDPTKLTGNEYEVFFEIQQQIRDGNGDWVPSGTVIRKINPNGPDDLSGSSIDIAAVHGPNTGTVQLDCYLNLVSPNGSWADGITMTFPAGLTILEAQSFDAGGGTVIPVINGQTVEMGIIDNSQTSNGVFHGGENWTIIVGTFQPPMTTSWEIFDDGFSGGAVNAEGITNVTDIGNKARTAYLWNLLNVTTNELTLEDISIVDGIDLFPPRDDSPTNVANPIVDGFQINVDVNYDNPLTYGLIKLNGESLNPSGDPGEPGTSWENNFWSISDWTLFGEPDGTSLTIRGYGTSSPDMLQQDYEFRWTGVEELASINGQSVYITQDETGSMATLYGARNYNIANHPLNPNPGSSNPFLVRVPFELWNKDSGTQINYQFYDRAQSDPLANNFKVWNTDARMYGEILSTTYDPEHIANGEMGGSDSEFYTWNNVWFMSQYQTGDLIETYYIGPIVPGVDQFTFSTPNPIVSVDDESLPLSFALFQNYPNPFNPTTKIRFKLPEPATVKLEIFDILGQRVVQLINKELNIGKHEIEFDARNLASGMYIYILNVKDKFFEAKKMIFLK